ncbi:MAG: hypothetical protein QOE89_744 [Pseudonocardiales bacterium]|jgi:hypothetical protein|nr:hypothetical protein [Pseudonocardiales bacterium]
MPQAAVVHAGSSQTWLFSSLQYEAFSYDHRVVHADVGRIHDFPSCKSLLTVGSGRFESRWATLWIMRGDGTTSAPSR